MVFIVGAGPGDAGLLTLRAAEVLSRAQVVLYDALVSEAVLAMLPSGCRKIFAGKRCGAHFMRQEEINAAMIRYARAGKRVVRLKGGDPFVFGRGGEEAQALHDAGIEFEIVPGISSALAVPAYAGIPVTHRGVSTSFTVVTGHEDPSKPHSQIDWRAVAAAGGTLVVLMGLRAIAGITQQLIAHGAVHSTPAAVIENGTLPAQRVITGTLGTIAGVIEDARMHGPCLLVIGEVVRLREQTAWCFPEQAASAYGT